MKSSPYRDNGAVGALLDEYDKALEELDHLIATIPDGSIGIIVDKETEDPDSKSIQTILTHVVRAGHWYNIEIKRALGEEADNPETIVHDSIEAYQSGLLEMFESTEKTFSDHPKADIEAERQFRWKHIYNIDMLLEHAIVHILRHRRQIERFLIKLESF